MKERATVLCKRGDRILLVARPRARWVLPGGKPRSGETLSILQKVRIDTEKFVAAFINILFPVIVGVTFRMLSGTDEKLGAEAVAGFLMIATIAGILMAGFLNNGGGAWDNAKKYIETGVHGGKKSDAHKAAVVGDTVGDPFKDTAGPSLHVLIKLLSTITLVLAPLFI